MAFGFDDFSKLFDPVSDILGTSGRQGVGLLQQKPEDIAMAAAAAYLMANGIPVTPEALAAAEPLAAAGPSAALTTDVAAMAPSQIAAMTPEVSGIMQGAQMDPALLESLNAPGTQTAGLGNLLETGYWEEPVSLNAPNIEEMGNEGILDYSSQVDNVQAQSPAYQDYVSSQRTGYGREIPESAFDKGMRKAGEYFDKASKYVDDNPYKSAGLAYYGAYKTGMLDQPAQEPIADNYKNPYSMAGFRRSSPNPSAYQYKPRYAEGGIASVHGYARGGRSKAQSAMDFYDAMNPQQEAPPLKHGDPGIYYDMDPDTRYLDPMEAAMVRMSKLNSRTNVQAPTMTPSRRMGELDFKPVAAAQGGIMGYAAGGDVPVEDDEFNRLTGRGGPSKYEDPNPSWTNATNAEKANWAREHPILAMPGRYFTSPASTLGAFVNLINPEGARAANSIFRGIDPTPNPAGGTGDPTSGRDAGVGDGLGDARASFSPVQAPGEQGRGAPAGNGDGVGRGPGGQDSAGQHGASLAHGGIAGYNLGGYAAGGNPRLLRGPGDGMSDHIPATINNRQPARLADGEYVITADVVSHLGNGSTEAGAKQLDAMMKRVRKGRTGTPKQGKQINPRKYLPA